MQKEKENRKKKKRKGEKVWKEARSSAKYT